MPIPDLTKEDFDRVGLACGIDQDLIDYVWAGRPAGVEGLHDTKAARVIRLAQSWERHGARLMAARALLATVADGD